jgi:hypothetical protein
MQDFPGQRSRQRHSVPASSVHPLRPGEGCAPLRRSLSPDLQARPRRDKGRAQGFLEDRSADPPPAPPSAGRGRDTVAGVARADPSEGTRRPDLFDGVRQADLAEQCVAHLGVASVSGGRARARHLAHVPAHLFLVGTSERRPGEGRRRDHGPHESRHHAQVSTRKCLTGPRATRPTESDQNWPDARRDDGANSLKRLAPQAGFEPATLRLTEATFRHHQTRWIVMKTIRFNEIARWLSRGSIAVNLRHNRCFSRVTSQFMSHGLSGRQVVRSMRTRCQTARSQA